MIHTIDPYESLYKITGESYEMRAMRKKDVMAVDHLISVVGFRSDIQTIDDWGALAKIIEFYSRQWPQEWSDYIKQVSIIRNTRARKDGYSRELGTSGTRYIATLPGGHFPKLLKIIFPNQQWTREFVEKLVRNIKITKVAEKTDTWFTIPDAPKNRYNYVEEAVKQFKKDVTSTKQKRKRG